MYKQFALLLLLASASGHQIIFANSYQELISETDISQLVNTIHLLPALISPLVKLKESARISLESKLQQARNETRVLYEMIDHSLEAHANMHSQLVRDAAAFEILQPPQIEG
jgi:hypothetical protein